MILFFASGFFCRWLIFITVVIMISIRVTILRFTLVDDIKIVLEGKGHKVVLKGVAQLEILVHLVSLVVFSSFVVTVTLALVLLLADVDALEEVEEGIALD